MAMAEENRPHEKLFQGKKFLSDGIVKAFKNVVT